MAKRKKQEKNIKEEDSQEVREMSSGEKNQDDDKISSIQSEDVGSSSVESDSDDEMLLMASKWAKQKEDELQDIGSKREPASPATTPYYPSNFTTSIKENNTYSLHVTNLPYNATKPEIMRYFMKKGCEISSTRLVYNHHVSRGDRDTKKLLPKSGFTGVAFIDFVNEESYNKALEMDKEYWIDENDNYKDQGKKDGRGWRRRRINVRPTKTKEELAQIVENTKQRLTMARQERADPEKNDSNEKISSKKRSHIDTVTETPLKKKRKINRKLTKKEKARKAAILKSKVTSR
jgi:RNA recognition motif-containing protein